MINQIFKFIFLLLSPTIGSVRVGGGGGGGGERELIINEFWVVKQNVTPICLSSFYCIYDVLLSKSSGNNVLSFSSKIKTFLIGNRAAGMRHFDNAALLI